MGKYNTKIMKYQVIAALVAVVSASKIAQKESPDCPESTQVFSYTEHVPVAAGFAQLGVRFATGMNGDEDLGEDITMKGDKFHYVQRPEVLAQNGQAYYLPTCTETYTTNCQPVCDEGTTVGCTEARTPIPPTKDRFEGKYTWK